MNKKYKTKRNHDRFPTTHWSAIVAVGSENEEERSRSFETIIEAYWKPVYKYLRLKWQRDYDKAADLTQAFFLLAMSKNIFNSYNPDKARFRTYLRTCLDRFVMNEDRAEGAEKRGGGTTLLSLDFRSAERELDFGDLASQEISPEEMFHREWIRDLFSRSITELKNRMSNSGKELHFELFSRYDLARDSENPPSYKSLSVEFDLPVTQVTNHLAAIRREFRKIVLENIRMLTASEREFTREVHEVLGVDVL